MWAVNRNHSGVSTQSVDWSIHNSPLTPVTSVTCPAYTLEVLIDLSATYSKTAHWYRDSLVPILHINYAVWSLFFVFSPVCRYMKRAWAHSAGPLNRVAIVTFFAAFTSLSSCVVLTILIQYKIYLSNEGCTLEKLLLWSLKLYLQRMKCSKQQNNPQSQWVHMMHLALCCYSRVGIHACNAHTGPVLSSLHNNTTVSWDLEMLKECSQ